FYQSGFPGLKAIGDPVGRGYYVVLVREGETELLRAINAAILGALESGELRRIYQKYGLWNKTQMLRGLEVNPQGKFIADATVDEKSSAVEDEAYQEVRGWGVLRQRGSLLIRAAGMTVILSITAMPLAVLIGLAIALVRRY